MRAASRTHTPARRSIRGRCRATDSATGTHNRGTPPAPLPTHGTTWAVPHPLRTRRPTRAAACPPAVHRTRTRTPARVWRAHTHTRPHHRTHKHQRSGAFQGTHIRTHVVRTPSHLRAHRRAPHPPLRWATRLKGAPQANPLHPPFTVAQPPQPHSPPRTRPTAPLGRRLHTHTNLVCAHGSRAKVPRPHAPQHTHTLTQGARRRQQVPGAGGNPTQQQTTTSQWHRRTHLLLARRAAGPPAAAVRLPLTREGPGVCISALVPLLRRGPVSG